MMKKRLFYGIFIISIIHVGKAQSWRIGAQVRAEQNFSPAQTSDLQYKGAVRQKIQMPGWGLHVMRNISTHLALDASVLFSRSVYELDYTSGTNVMLDADLRFTQTNLNLEYLFFSQDHKFRPALFAGIQHLYRRYGVERYQNGVIPDSYWSRSRLFGQAGLGFHISDAGGVDVYPFAGIRINQKKRIIYDQKINQVFCGIAVTFQIKDRHRHVGSAKCPDFF